MLACHADGAAVEDRGDHNDFVAPPGRYGGTFSRNNARTPGAHEKKPPQSDRDGIQFGARSRDRTGTAMRPRDFKSLVSTYFTIRALPRIIPSGCGPDSGRKKMRWRSFSSCEVVC